jgi:UDP-N-acetylmuramate: L-alanyl-gamma-D-glutamyl-meso-diaminopimelate ligase
MRLGSQAADLAQALGVADLSFVFVRPDLQWDVVTALAPLGERLQVSHELDGLIARICEQARPGDRVLVMSNGDFGGLHGRLLKALGA